MIRKYGMMICVAVAAFLAGLYVDHSSVAEAQGKNRVFELRTYKAAEGKLEPLLARFRNHSVELLEQHGMPTVGFWVAADAPESEDTLVYVLAHPSREAADESWKVFQADPEWQEVARASQVDGRLVTSVERLFMNPIDFSPMKWCHAPG